MIFPVGDDQVHGGAKPIFSYAFIGMNVILFLLQMSVEGNLICEYGAIPNEIVGGQDYFTLFSSMFMHGGWMHLIGNMLFLWVFGDNIEATVGNLPFAAFYILGGLAAHAAHIYFSTGNEMLSDCCSICSAVVPCQDAANLCPGSIPTVGASGAIAAVLGAYLVMFPKSKVKILVLYFFQTFKVPAILFLGFWIGQQLLSGFASLGPEAAASGGVAWWAHIGGFAFGVIAGFVARTQPKVKAAQPENYKPPKPGDFV